MSNKNIKWHTKDEVHNLDNVILAYSSSFTSIQLRSFIKNYNIVLKKEFNDIEFLKSIRKVYQGNISTKVRRDNIKEFELTIHLEVNKNND